MKTKNPNPYRIVKNLKTDPLLTVYFQLNHLKQIYRRGWLLRGLDINHCESVADHLFGVAILTLFLGKEYFPHLDVNKLIIMSLVHEIGEVFVGDITPKDDVTPEEKHMWERKAMLEILSNTPHKELYISLWEEYEDGKTDEAKVLREIDILEMGLQANIYMMQHAIDFNDIVDWTQERLTDERLKKLLTSASDIKNTTQKEAKTDKI